MISWIGPVILMFAALAPGSPWKMLFAGFMAASMDPLGMVIAQAAGRYHFGPFDNALIMHYPELPAAGRRRGDLPCGHPAGTPGGQGTGDGQLPAWASCWAAAAWAKSTAPPTACWRGRRPSSSSGPRCWRERSGESASLAVARFRREAEAAANLRSPHTVELYDFGVTDDGTLYFVMELLEGMDLETLVRREGPLPAKRVIHILRQVCESLEEAHASGLVHRDIKPANIHIGRVGLRHDFVKVLDFGLVKSVGSLTGEDSMATAAGLTPGTPAYMAPEMALGEEVDGRADIYALGCVAYYLLTGRLVFEGTASIPGDRKAHSGNAGSAVAADRARYRSGARPPGALLPGQEPGGSAPDGRASWIASWQRSRPSPGVRRKRSAGGANISRPENVVLHGCADSSAPLR